MSGTRHVLSQRLTKKRLVGAVIVCLVFLVVCRIVFLTPYPDDEPLYFPQNPMVVFPSGGASTEHVIPFLFHGTIWLRTSFGKGDVWAFLDSGAVIASCPADFGVSGVKWKDVQKASVGGPSPRSGTLVILPSVALHGCDLQKCPVIEYVRLPGEINRDDLAIIPLSVFNTMSVTIDFKRSQLILSEKRRAADATASPDPRNDLGAPVWLPLVPASYEGWGPYPVVRGTIDGIRVNFVLDTGSAGGLWVTNSKLFSALQRTASLPSRNDHSGPQKTPAILTGDWSLGPLHGNAQMIFGAKAGVPAIDASIGNAVLRDYRITIDYPNNRVCFERYITPRQK